MQVPEPGFRACGRAHATRGFTPFSPARGGRALPIDMDGRPVHARKLQGPGSINRRRLTDDGTPFETQDTPEGPPLMAGKGGPLRERDRHCGAIAREDCDDSRRHDARRPAARNTLRIAREVPDDAPHPRGRIQEGTIA